MGLRRIFDRMTKSTDELDREALAAWIDTHDVRPLDAVVDRELARYGGEVRSVRIVPRAGADALEVTLQDGRGSLTAVFLGRRRIAGLGAGRRLVVEGVPFSQDGRHLVLNPWYRILPRGAEA